MTQQFQRGDDTMARQAMRLAACLFAAMTLLMADPALFAQAAPQGGGRPGGGQGRGRGPQAPPLILTTTAFEDGGVIPN
jgi:hypothetical protein